MVAPRESQPRTRRSSVRYHARLDAETYAKLEELAAAFHRKRAAILRHVMPWGPTQIRGWTVDMTVPGMVCTVGMLFEPELLQQVQGGAAARDISIAAWLRHTLQQVTVEDFPGGWRTGMGGIRSHESAYYQRRCMLHLDDAVSERSDTWT